MTIGKGLRPFLLAWLILLRPCSSFSGELSYQENLELNVVFDSKSYQFYEVYNGRTPRLLFEVKKSEMLWFIQAGQDLVSFRKKRKILTRIVVAGFSTYLMFSLNIAAGIGASLIMEGKVVPKTDSTLSRVAYFDINYLVLSSNNPNFSEKNYEYNVAQVIDSLLLIYEEFAKRMTPTWKKSELLGKIYSEGNLNCHSTEKSDWEVGFPSIVLGDTEFIARKIKTDKEITSYQLFPVYVNGERFPNLNWPGYQTGDPVAVIHFESENFNIKGLDLGNPHGLAVPPVSLDSRSLFANVSERTAAVNQNLIHYDERLDLIFDWTLAIKTCLTEKH